MYICIIINTFTARLLVHSGVLCSQTLMYIYIYNTYIWMYIYMYTYMYVCKYIYIFINTFTARLHVLAGRSPLYSNAYVLAVASN